ncbi:hypothetical protein PGTUg99_032787 [Puccinia graminis f. sp. tritici]|uniref:Uncharacterized protein n=1 Tax=Puccinia graminis f. sp. tritici TaxID=56615 RepID=A0A5B0S800_PUCGR|nr:hypothetical protein PGTUg99_032787 [Puccinia graminis f. sp. tritici]
MGGQLPLKKFILVRQLPGPSPGSRNQNPEDPSCSPQNTHNILQDQLTWRPGTKHPEHHSSNLENPSLNLSQTLSINLIAHPSPSLTPSQTLQDPQEPLRPPGGCFFTFVVGSRRIVWFFSSDHCRALGTRPGPSDTVWNTQIALGTSPKPPNDSGLSSDAPEPTGSLSDNPGRPPTPLTAPKGSRSLPNASRGPRSAAKRPRTPQRSPRTQETPPSAPQGPQTTYQNAPERPTAPPKPPKPHDRRSGGLLDPQAPPVRPLFTPRTQRRTPRHHHPP